MSKVQLRRLVKIDKIIAEKRPGGEHKYPNCTTLAEACEVSTKTIQRDLAFMIDESHAPIAYDKTKRGYYYTEPSYRFPAISITQGDLFAIFVAEKALMQYENTPLYEKLVPIFQQIAEALPDKSSINPSWVDSKFSFFPKPAAKVKSGVWDAVAEALRRSRTLEVCHRVPGYDEAMPRRLDPYHVVGYGREWYVIGYCHYRKEIRTFAMSRSQEARVLQ